MSAFREVGTFVSEKLHLGAHFGKKHILVKENMNPQNLTPFDFEIMRTLGTGSFGRVHLVRLRRTGEFFAMKAMKKSDIVRLKQVDHTKNERNLLFSVNHPFLVNAVCSMQDSKHIFVVMEYVMGGELFSILRKAQRFPHHVAKFYAAEVILAFEYLHDRDIVYRDLKPENILISRDGHIKITDFGFAKHLPDNVTWTLCGTPDYLAPEIIQSKGYGKAVDWYSLGVLIFEMIAGYPPFYNQDHVKLYEAIVLGHVRFPSQFDSDAKDLVRNLLTGDLSKRYGNLKNGVSDIKNHAWFKGVDWEKLEQKALTPPYIPPIKSIDDTSHFDKYPEEATQYGISCSDAYAELFKDF